MGISIFLDTCSNEKQKNIFNAYISHQINFMLNHLHVVNLFLSC